MPNVDVISKEYYVETINSYFRRGRFVSFFYKTHGRDNTSVLWFVDYFDTEEEADDHRHKWLRHGFSLGSFVDKEDLLSVAGGWEGVDRNINRA